jgi:hypothetical protein
MASNIVPSPTPDPIHGLPPLDHDSLAILTSSGDVVVAKQCRLTRYRPGGKSCHSSTKVELKEPITALAESPSGVIVAAGEVLRSAMCH